MSPDLVSKHRPSLAQFAAHRRAIEPHALPTYCLCLLGVTVIAASVTLGPFHCDPVFIGNVLQSTLAVAAFAWAARWIGFARVADLVEQVLLLFASGIVCAFCAVICASTAAPLADPVLRQADMLLFGIDRTSLIADLGLSAGAMRLWTLAYDSFAVTPLLAMLLLLWRGERWRAWAVLSALMTCAAIMIVFLLMTPAFGTPPFPYAFEAVLAGVRSGELRTLDTSVITGIVTFPSMHAADAVILAVAFSWLGRWAVPLVVLNIAMFFSALIVGGHYAVDLLAGGCIGFVCITGAQRLHARLASVVAGRTHVVDTDRHYICV
ncbi:membrane-associated phospholipid phosphatase [Sphingomonas insulae]|uniref:Phosphatase PAP2 family protein n=1 Tax=Sphingomonas insulae TaxID=424800 RepID=A0ABN1HNU5_9SPHN|nr:phosphatase PAP2 family protein [Sphingomonas insulae]NIJ30844.1 membrane-associated phospholipid phosphatase [Sphingomonas insulae]